MSETQFWREVKQVVQEEIDRALARPTGIRPGVHSGITFDRYGRATFAGSAAGLAPGWYIDGIVEPGEKIGPVFYIKQDVTITSIASYAKIPDASEDATIEIRRYRAAAWSTICSGITDGTLTTVFTLTTPALLAGDLIALDIPDYEGTDMEGLTIQLFF